MNAETGQRIGNTVGKAMEVDKDEDELAVGEFLRVKTLIDIRKPLLRGITMEKGDGGEECWGQLKYEFLPNFCYSCGLLGHVEKDCDETVRREEEKQFGDWLRVNPSRRKEGRGRWSEGGSSGGSQQHRKESNWGRNPGTKKKPFSESSRKQTGQEEEELKDDGESPLKNPANIEHMGTLRRLDFPVLEAGERGTEKQVVPTLNTANYVESTDRSSASLAPRTMLAGGKPGSDTDYAIDGQVIGGDHAEYKSGMEIDNEEDTKVGEGQEPESEDKEANNELQSREEEKGKRMLKDGGQKASTRATFKRRPRSCPAQKKVVPVVGKDKKKRNAEGGIEEEAAMQKRRCNGERVSGDEVEQQHNVSAGLPGQSRQNQ